MFKIGDKTKIPSGLGGVYEIKITAIKEGKLMCKILGKYSPKWVLTYTQESLKERSDYCLKGGRL